MKYKTAGASVTIDGNKHELKDQGGHPGGRKRFINDLDRLENFVGKNGGHGYAIFLTNDPQYWKETRYEDVLDLEFRLPEAREFSGKLEWQEEKDWMSGPLLREVDLDNEYDIDWKYYSYDPVPENE